MLKAEKYRKTINQSRAAGDLAAEREAIRLASNTFVNHIVDRWDFKVNIIGEENLPTEGPVVYIANHQSYGDALGTLKAITDRHQIGYIGKDYFAKIPYFGSWVTRLRSIYIQRGNTRNSLRVINDGVEYLKDGFSLFIFPEGTRTKSSDIGEFKPGSFKLATKARVPIVPITLNGGYHLYEDQEYIIHGHAIDVLVHPPIPTADLDRRHLAALPQQVEAQIREGLRQILDGEIPEAVTAETSVYKSKPEKASNQSEKSEAPDQPEE